MSSEIQRPRIPNYELEKSFDWEYVFKLNRYIEYLELQLEIKNIPSEESEKVYCDCIDRCSFKRKGECIRKRECVHQIKK